MVITILAVGGGVITALGDTTVDSSPVKFDEDPIMDPSGPMIVDFGWSNPSGQAFIFTGRVACQNPAGLAVTFGGILAGQSATTHDDGSFILPIYLSPDEYGIATAQAVDQNGIPSNVAQTIVF